jgi:hypothetical protein
VLTCHPQIRQAKSVVACLLGRAFRLATMHGLFLLVGRALSDLAQLEVLPPEYRWAKLAAALQWGRVSPSELAGWLEIHVIHA